jgi:hypothetical protein
MYFETGVIGGTWLQREGILSALVPPERMGAFVATSPALIEGDLLAEMVEAMGERAADPLAIFFRRWGVDPWTEGYITSWRPGDVMAVGPLHGTHEPPFYVCGSDQWVCGYMEGPSEPAAAPPGRCSAAADRLGRAPSAPEAAAADRPRSGQPVGGQLQAGLHPLDHRVPVLVVLHARAAVAA